MNQEKLLISDSKSNNSEDMSNKQIEEMAKVIEGTERMALDVVGAYPSPRMYATDLYNKGYRKHGDVINEFANRFEYHLRNATFTPGQTNDIQYALKKATEEMKGGAE